MFVEGQSCRSIRLLLLMLAFLTVMKSSCRFLLARRWIIQSIHCKAKWLTCFLFHSRGGEVKKISVCGFVLGCRGSLSRVAGINVKTADKFKTKVSLLYFLLLLLLSHQNALLCHKHTWLGRHRNTWRRSTFLWNTAVMFACYDTIA